MRILFSLLFFLTRSPFRILLLLCFLSFLLLLCPPRPLCLFGKYEFSPRVKWETGLQVALKTDDCRHGSTVTTAPHLRRRHRLRHHRHSTATTTIKTTTGAEPLRGRLVEHWHKNGESKNARKHANPSKPLVLKTHRKRNNSNHRRLLLIHRNRLTRRWPKRSYIRTIRQPDKHIDW